ncbi:MAG: SRPBCC family protein [Pseudomonadota bacterium]
MKQESEGSFQITKWLGGMALGAVAMYLADPAQGRRRRALAQDQMRHFTNKTSDGINAAVHDVVNRLSGLQARVRQMMERRNYKPIDDHVLEARVRSRLGRAVSNPHSINVVARRGQITLSGPVLAREYAQLIDMVRAIPGVAAVRDELDVHDQSNGTPGLQGRKRRSKARAGLMQQSWPPARIVATVGGGLMAYYGWKQRSPLGIAMAAVGAGLLSRNLFNLDLVQVIGAGAGTQMLNVRKTIEIDASPETVFDVWTQYQNFPHFMSHVTEVRDLGQQRSHWTVQGPAGTSIEWNAVLTDSVRPTRLAWESEPGAMVDNAGSVHLEPTEHGTRATVEMSYSPPVGAMGQSVAALLGRDPARDLEDDLLKMKNFIERGIPTRPSAAAGLPSGGVLH